MHAGFAFLELGTVRKKNQVNALVKILVDFSVSTVAYFLVGYGVAYGIDPMPTAKELAPLGDTFRPYRTLAAWYCWQAIIASRANSRQ